MHMKVSVVRIDLGSLLMVALGLIVAASGAVYFVGL
jgi:hypothetical protein